MAERVKPEGMNFMEWLGAVVGGDPEAYAAYKDEADKHTLVPKTYLAALEEVARCAQLMLDKQDRHLSSLELWRHKPLGSDKQTLYAEHAEALDGARSRMVDALTGLEFYEAAYGGRS